jgi:hypothetical protein
MTRSYCVASTLESAFQLEVTTTTDRNDLTRFTLSDPERK